ncbi:hypothetical protein LCGC14_0686630 [marine sediment metagenome]|uniref:ASCH domain-containing protein n=1 Tax=marine sediment metagenome TaxID=412755 RepID=A0A0F9T7W7_9ZZZZ
MKDRPILFSTDMVKAILEGRKAMTRRIIKKEIKKELYPGELLEYCPYGQVGDRLWVRETWRTGRGLDGLPPRLSGVNSPFQYKADMSSVRGNDVTKYSPWGKWRPSIFMPRWASRINLEITGVRVERLREITLDDIQLEGFKETNLPPLKDDIKAHESFRKGLLALDLATRFGRYWDTLNAKRGYGWSVNPWVWVVDFKQKGNNI